MMAAALALAAASPVTIPQVLGTGTLSCASYVESKGKPIERSFYIEWALGFASSYNIYNKDGVMDVTGTEDKPAIAAWLDNYCAARPLIPFATATEALLLELQRLRR